MKYGETLRQRSIPEWVYYNIDYNEIKHLIKVNTTPGKGKAVSIPGQGQSVERDFENSLYGILLNEHDRIGLFVKSKSFEIQRRLELLDRKLRQLQLRDKSGLEAPHLGKYARLEQDAIKTGEEIQSLSRFIGAQRLAFKKLLKKYQKWTGSDALAVRFRAEVTSRPTSFTNVSLSGQLDDWSDALQIIRAARNPDAATKAKKESVKTPLNETTQRESSNLVASSFNTTIASGSAADFDATFADTPIGQSGTKAVYWVHQDQLIELQVALLQLLRLYLPKHRHGSSSSVSQSSIVTRRSSVSRKDSPMQSEKEDECGFIVLDQLEDYAQRQSRSTVSDSEDFTRKSYAKPAAVARWTAADEVVVSFRQSKDSISTRKTRVRKKHLGALLDTERDCPPWKDSETSNLGDSQKNYSSKDESMPQEMRDLLSKHPDIKPLVAVCSRRTRFVGLSNTVSEGQWCVLDSDISVNDAQQVDLAGKDWASNLSRNATAFPFAVLQVRQEGKLAKSIIDILDKSHLTERIRGFTLSSHAVWECHKPKNMTTPFWLPALARDIRKVPEALPKSRRIGLQSQTTSPQESSSTSDPDPSGSSTAVVTGESSVTSVPTTPIGSQDFDATAPQKKQRRVTYQQEAILRDQASKATHGKGPRYWSEYDHPEDGSDDENGYYLYIDSTASDKFLGQETAEYLYARLKKIFRKHDHSLTVDEENPLLASPFGDEISSSPTDTEDERPKKRNLPKVRTYGTTLPNAPNQRVFSTYSTLLDLASVNVTSPPPSSYRLHIASLSLAASAIICVIIGTLAATGRNRLRGEVDAGILFGVVSSLFFALVGMVSVVTARESMTAIKWVIVSAVFIPLAEMGEKLT
ncbi:hypothetical protein EJ08DRAFT_695941 [Tothia fuscella]|uniref:SPX domain-containing protein n=1 Tax=Tothia fuscella TaxID=1048955 RepID=A0A9P4NUT7_9PEZI|nr:hypothetical protein EJ08DRAFT_695941 [Tothia fuscella]